MRPTRTRRSGRARRGSGSIRDAPGAAPITGAPPSCAEVNGAERACIGTAPGRALMKLGAGASGAVLLTG